MKCVSPNCVRYKFVIYSVRFGTYSEDNFLKNGTTNDIIFVFSQNKKTSKRL